MYFDSGSAIPKNYTNIKNVLDDALNRYYLKDNGLKREVVIRGMRVFGHKTEFPCMKQPKDSTMKAIYAIHHMREFVRDHRLLVDLSSLTTWVNDFATVARKISYSSCIAFNISLGNSLVRLSAVRRGCSTMTM
jgi:hypothetical protein